MNACEGGNEIYNTGSFWIRREYIGFSIRTLPN